MRENIAAPARSGAVLGSIVSTGKIPALLAGVLASVACGGEAAPGQRMLSTGQFSLEGDFVALETEGELAELPAGADVPASGAGFYLAIKRTALSERWFLSSFMKQFYPGNAGIGGDTSFGTRVISFREQGGRLNVFDASDRFQASAIGDPELLIEAYPIVDSPEFDALPNAEDYVLVDPANGLNEFGVSGNVFNDPYLGDGNLPLRVGLSFTQNFRRLSDGVTFEEVFAGDLDLGTGDGLDIWGTLGVALRRYSEGEGYVATADPGTSFYFLSNPRLVPDSHGLIAADPIRWNFKPGMQPLQVFVSAGAQRAQADYPDADIIGALRRGIESYNDVLGFRALEAVFVDDDRIRDEDSAFFLVDYPGEDLGFARADFGTNPNTGEIRHGSVYMSGVFFDFSRFEPAGDETELPALPEPEAPSGPAFSWGGMAASGSVCELRPYHGGAPAGEAEPELTPEEQGARYIQFVAAHEVGHMLGLRHNFKGSLVPPSSSVMEYSFTTDAIAIAGPQAYDVAALRYLYQLSDELPTQPFCTDEDTLVDPYCVTFDAGAHPVSDWFAQRLPIAHDAIFDEAFPVEVLEAVDLNALLGYARDVAVALPEERVAAVGVALGRAAVPLAPADAQNPVAVDAANAIASYVLRRIALDPPELRGSIGSNVTDPGALQAISDQAGRMLRNEDGIRTFELRRTSVDVLHALQTDAALAQLRASLDALTRERLGSDTSSDDQYLLEDLIVRVGNALTPYYD
jgi:hypothetical protein